MEKDSYFEELQKIPCFKKSFTYGISSGIIVGLANFIFTSRVKRSTDRAFVTFGVVTMAYWVYCRYHYEKEHFLSQKMNSAVHEVMLKEGRTRTPDS